MRAFDGDSICLGALAFFGKITGSISHEIRGQLAILKEESGLVADLLALAQRGRPIDLARIERLIQQITSRADAIDEIVTCMNRFSHSVDEEWRAFDVDEVLALVVRLCQRLAAMKRVTLNLSSSPCCVQITSNPFQFQRLLFLIIEQAMIAAGEGGTVSIAAEDQGEWVTFHFDGAFAADSSMLRGIEDQVGDLLACLNAEIVEEKNPASLRLSLPSGTHIERRPGAEPGDQDQR